MGHLLHILSREPVEYTRKDTFKTSTKLIMMTIIRLSYLSFIISGSIFCKSFLESRKSPVYNTVPGAPSSKNITEPGQCPAGKRVTVT